ncbi:MAG: sodium:proton antiporter NhaD [Bacteroidia bacterium]|nr:sodium:proton antiporter NhaD [Bacteroidia bacterium]MCO5252823.1 sodium:proton antiporter NhaD [Bacteroidota bacterium]
MTLTLLVVIIFILGYVAITLEHTIKIDKLVPALLMMVLIWSVITLGLDNLAEWIDSPNEKILDGFAGLVHAQKEQIMGAALLHHFGKTAEILIFLIGAMAIVELIDYFEGFSTVKSFVTTRNKKTLLWIISILAFFLSAIIDNLTATIVLISILRKLLPENKDRIWYASFIIIAANAGGAWSPIGDITTTMLWIGKKVTAVKLMEYLLLPSIISILIPLVIGSFLPAFNGKFDNVHEKPASKYHKIMFFLGLGMIAFVPLFKTITHLPPYIGMMFSFAVVSIAAEYFNFHQKKSSLHILDKAEHHPTPTSRALSWLEIPSVLFFLGILMAVAGLESMGLIHAFGTNVQQMMPDELFVFLLGAASAIIDNVPLVAASMGMFNFPVDEHIWHFIAYAAGTGGSMLIIGSAAGVVAMGMEKISFFWYIKNIAWLALLGYLAGYGFMMLFHSY